MEETAIDYAAVFQALPGMVALLTTGTGVRGRQRGVRPRLSGRTREQLIGRYLFDVFPDNPNDPAATGMRNLEASLCRVLATGERDAMALQRYDVEDPERPGRVGGALLEPGERAAASAPTARCVLILHRVEEVTELIRARGGARAGAAGPGSWRPSCTPARASCRSSTNGCVRRTPGSGRWRWPCRRRCCPHRRQVSHHRAAVRYRPAVGALNVCGDWYDLVDLVGGHRIGVSVGDVVGHGLEAAGVMGQLRSALSAASRVADGTGPGPGRAGALRPRGRRRRVGDRRDDVHRLRRATPSPTAAPAIPRPS